jgi:hypothetical protein
MSYIECEAEYADSRGFPVLSVAPDDSKDQREMAERCFGFGRWDAPYWFIGPEQGKGPDEAAQNDKRVEAWIRLGSHELSDCFEFHRLIGEDCWHRDRPRLQRTWRPLIVMLKTFLGEPVDNKDDLRSYQRDVWGRAQGETCVIELSGIAAKNSRALVDRERFKEERVNLIRERMLTYRPKLVVIYGAKDKQSWAKIAGVHLSSVDTALRSDYGLIAFAAHPNTRGRRDESWKKLGRELRAAAGSSV